MWKESRPSGVERGIDTSSTLPSRDLRSVDEFERLLRVHDRQVRALAWRLVHDDVDDVLQQAYLKAFLQRHDFRGDASFGTWLHRIVYTTALDHLRSGQRRTHREQGSARHDRVADDADQVLDHLVLEAALDTLPADQRTVLLMIDGQGFSYDDVAHVLDVAPGTIASRLHRARAAVRARLRTDEHDGGAR